MVNKDGDTVLDTTLEVKRAELAYMISMEIVASNIENAFQPFIFCGNSQYSFSLRKFAPAKEWSLTEVERNARMSKTSKLNKLEWAERELCKHYFIRGQSLRDIIGKKDFKLGKVKSDGNSKLVYFSAGSFDGWMRLVPSHKWHISEYRVTSTGRLVLTSHCVHDVRDSESGYPLLVARTESFVGDKGKGDTTKEEYQITEHQGLDETEFGLAAFGFPEPTYSDLRPRGSSTWWYIIGLGAVLLGVARLLWTLHKRKSLACVDEQV